MKLVSTSACVGDCLREVLRIFVSKGEKLKREANAGGGGGDFGAKKFNPRGAMEANSSNSDDVTIFEIRSKKEFVLISLIRGTRSGIFCC